MNSLGEVESAAQTIDQLVEAERTKAIDVVRSPNAEAAHRAVAESVLARERLRVSLAKLRARLSETLTAEAQERWSVEFARVKRRRDEAVVAFSAIVNFPRRSRIPFSCCTDRS